MATDLSIEDKNNQDSTKGSFGVFIDKAQSGVKSSKDWAIEGIKNFSITDSLGGAISTGISGVKEGYKVGSNIVSGVYDTVKQEGISGLNPFKIDVLDKIQTDTQVDYDDNQRQLGKELNDMGGFQMAKDLTGMLGTLGGQLFTGDEVQKNLRSDIKVGDFNKNIENINKTIFDTQDKMKNLTMDNKFSRIKTFQNNVYQQYLSKYGDYNEEDFVRFYQEKLSELTPKQKNDILKEQSLYEQEINNYQQEITKQEQQLQEYINQTVVGTEGRTGYDFYTEVKEKEQNKMKENKYMSLIGEIYTSTSEKVDNDIRTIGVEKISDYEGFNDFKDAIIDNTAADRQYELSILGMKDFPLNEEIARKLSTVNKAFYDLNIGTMKEFIDQKQLSENKGLTDVELKEKALKNVYKNLSQEKKDLLNSREQLINQVGQLREAQQMGDRFTSGSFKDKALGILDLTAYGGITVKRVIDSAFAYDQEVPHYIQQETRNLLYSSEGNWSKFKSVLAYNPDAMIAMGADILLNKKALVQPLEKGMELAGKGIMLIPTKVGYGEGTLRFVGGSVKNLTASQIFGAGIDPILDSHMMEAPTNTIESFNYIANIFFDTSALAGGAALKGGSKTMNAISYKFLVDGKEKEAIKEFTKAMEVNQGIKLSEVEAKKQLDYLKNGLYQSLYNPNEIKKLFEEKGSLYKFLSNNIQNMQKDGVDKILTEKGLALELINPKNLVGINETELKDIGNFLDIAMKYNTTEDKVKSQVARKDIDNLLNKSESLFTPQGADNFQFKSEVFKLDTFKKIKSEAQDVLEDLRESIRKPESINKAKFIQDLNKFNGLLTQAQRSFESNQRFVDKVKLRNLTDNIDIEIDLKLLEENTGANLSDLAAAGKDGIKVTKEGEYKGKIIGVGSQTDTYVFKKKFNEYINTQTKELEEILNEFKNDNLGDLFTIDELKGGLKTLMFGEKTVTSAAKEGGVIKFNFLLKEDIKPELVGKVLDKIGKTYTDIVNGFFKDSEGFIPTKPLDINSGVYKEKDNLKSASSKQIQDYVSNVDGLFNIAYGKFIPDFGQDKGKLVNAMYLTFGKDLSKYENIKIDIGIKKGEEFKGGTFSVYTSSMMNLRNEIYENVIQKDGTLNLKEALSKVNAQRGANKNVDDYFVGEKLNETKVKETIKSVVEASGVSLTNKRKNKLNDFILESFEGIGRGYDPILETMIINLTYKYLKHESLIDTFLSKQIKGLEADKIYASFVLSDSQAKKIAQRLQFNKTELPKSKQLEELEIQAWDRYRKSLETKRIQQEENLKNTQAYLDNNRNKLPQEAIDTLEDELKRIQGRIDSFNSEITRSEKPFKDGFVVNIVKNNLLKMADDFSVLRNSDAETKRLFAESKSKAIGEFTSQIKLNEELRIKFKENTIEQSKDLDSFIAQIKEAIKSNDIEDFIKVNRNIDETTDEYLKSQKEKIRDILKNIKDKQYDFIDKDSIVDYFKGHETANQLMSEAAAKKLNPLMKDFSNFLNGSQGTAEDYGVSEAILKYFTEKDLLKEINNVYDLYQSSPKFQSLIKLTNIIDYDKNGNGLYKLLDGSIGHYKEMESQLKSTFNDILKDINVRVLDKNGNEGDIKSELMDLMLQDNKFIKRLRNVANKTNYQTEDKKNRVISFKSEKLSEYQFYDKGSLDGKYIDRVLKLDNMIAGGMNIGIINTPKFSKLGYIDGKKTVTLGKVFRNSNKEVYKNIDDILKSENDYIKAIEAYRGINRDLDESYSNKLFADIFNRKDSEVKNIKLLKKNRKGGTYEEDFIFNPKDFINDTWIKNYYNTGYYYAGSFGDKDSVHTLYRAPQELIDSLGLTKSNDINKLSGELYELHYAYSEGYIKKEGEYNTFDDIIKRLKEVYNEGGKVIDEIRNLTNSETIKTSAKKKREASNMSNYSIIQGKAAKEKLDTLVLQAVYQEDNIKSITGITPIYKKGKLDNEKQILKYIEDNYKLVLENIKKTNINNYNIIEKELGIDAPKDKLVQAIEGLYLKDNDDGTSFATKDVIIKLLMSDLGISRAKAIKEYESGSARQIKSHSFEDLKINGRNVRFFGKHLVNGGEVKKGDEVITNTHFVGANSAKLDEAVEWIDEAMQYIVTIDGKEYKVVGKVPGTTMGIFKNASSTLLEEHTDTTVSNSIQAVLGDIYARATEEIQKRKIVELYDIIIERLKSPDSITNAYSKIDQMVNSLVTELRGVGKGNESIVQNKISDFLTEAAEIINKPNDEGQSVFIKYSDHNLGLNETKMGPNSPLVKIARRDTARQLFPDLFPERQLKLEEIDEIMNKLTKEEKELIDNNLYSVGYRYPVPSRYNMGVYKIILDDKLGNNEVVLHPFSTYLKLEGDNDGDHVFFLSAFGEWGNILAKDLLDRKLDDNLLKFLQTNEWNNKFIVADQVEKGAETGERISFLEGRLAALDAKDRIGVVAALGRTIKLLRQMATSDVRKEEIMKKMVTINELNELGESVSKEIFFEEFLKSFPGLKTIDIQQLKNNDQYYASLLQLTLDFASSDQKQFDPYWFVELVGSTLGYENSKELKERFLKDELLANINQAIDNTKNEEKLIKLNTEKNRIEALEDFSNDSVGAEQLFKIFEAADFKLTPFSVNYGKVKIDNLTIGNLSQEPKFKYFQDLRRDNVNVLLGSKRYLIEELIKNQGNLIYTLNKTETLTFLKNNVLGGSTETAWAKEWKKILDDAESEKDRDGNVIGKMGFVSNTKKENLLKQLKAPTKISDGAKEIHELIGKLKLTDDKKEKSKIREEIQQLMKKYYQLIPGDKEKEILDKNGRIYNILELYLSGENKLMGYLTDYDKADYLINSDIARQKTLLQIDENDLASAFANYRSLPKQEFLDSMKGIVDEMNSQINTLKSSIDGADNTVKINELEQKLKAIQEEVDKVTDEEFIPQVEIKSEELSVLENKVAEYKFPTITSDLIEVNPQEAMQIVYDTFGGIKKSESFLKIKISHFFDKYASDFVKIYDNIRDFLNKDLVISVATEDHIHHMTTPWFIPSKKGISAVVKKSGMKNVDNFFKDIQGELLGYDKQFTINNFDTIINNLKKKVSGTMGEKLFKQSSDGGLLDQFTTELKDYIEKVAEPVAYKLNELEKVYGYKVNDMYPFGQKQSLITDVIEAHKSNGQLAMKLSGIQTEEQFRKIIKDRMDDAGGWGWLNNGHLNIMTKMLFNKESDMVDKLVGWAKSFHYQMTYGTASTLMTGNGMVTGIAQLLPNYMEINAYLRRHGDKLNDANILMNRYNLLNAESAVKFMTGGQELQKSGAIDQIFMRTMQLIGINHPKTNKITSMMHMYITNPLGGFDHPLENIRKLAAVAQAMQEFGMRNIKDFEKLFNLHGESFLSNFRHKSNLNFAETGGGVTSSAQIYRETIFTHLHEYIDIPGLHLVAKFFSQTMGYLMGWSYHKAATLIEKETAIFSALNKLFRGDYQTAQKHFEDWFAFNEMLARYTMMTLGLHLKFQKFEKDNNERIEGSLSPFSEFQRSFNNQFVAFEILIDRRISAWETAGKYGGTTGEQLEYTAFSEMRNILRLFKQGKFIKDVYDHYQMESIHGQQDIMNSLKFAMDTHYTGYMRFNGLTQAQDHYNSLQAKGLTGLLGVGGLTDEEELFKALMTGKMFNSYQDKGAIMGLLNVVGFGKSDTSGGSFGLTVEMAKRVKELIVNDPEIRKLISGGMLGTGDKDFNLEMLLGKSGDVSTETQLETISELFNYITNQTFTKYDKSGNKISETYLNKYQLLLKKNLDEALNKEGISLDNLMKLKETNPEAMLKYLVDIEAKHNLPHPVVIGLILNEMSSNIGKEKYKELGRKLEENEWLEIKKDLILANQNILNLNGDFVFRVIDEYSKDKFGDLFKEYEDKFSNAGFSIQDSLDIVNRSYLIGQVVSKDTSVTKLHSKYALALRGVGNNETGVAIVNNFLQGLFELDYLDEKEKLANAAAAIMGLNKATFNMLKDNKEFMKLTEGSRKLLANWMYKVGRESIQYDPNTLLNEIGKASGGGTYGGSKFRPAKYKSSSFGGERPNYSKQFDPIRQMIPTVVQDLAKDPNQYLRDRNGYTDNPYYNPMRNPIRQQYMKIVIENLFQGFRSKGIIEQRREQKDFDKGFKKDIKLRKPKKTTSDTVKTIPKQIKKHTRGLNPNLPLGTQK